MHQQQWDAWAEQARVVWSDTKKVTNTREVSFVARGLAELIIQKIDHHRLVARDEAIKLSADLGVVVGNIAAQELVQRGTVEILVSTAKRIYDKAE